MGAFICKPLLYCYIIFLCHVCPPMGGSASYALSERHTSGKPSGYMATRNLSPDYLSVGCRSAHWRTGMTTGGVIFHPIHVATTNIEYNKTDNKLEIICTIFTDDFEAALAKDNKTKIDLNKPEMHAAMDALVKSYIAANLKISTDNAPVNLNYLGFEINREATDVYFESDKIPSVKKVDVDASLIYNLFDDQINIVHIIVGGVRKSEKVDYPAKRVEQVF